MFVCRLCQIVAFQSLKSCHKKKKILYFLLLHANLYYSMLFFPYMWKVKNTRFMHTEYKFTSAGLSVRQVPSSTLVWLRTAVNQRKTLLHRTGKWTAAGILGHHAEQPCHIGANYSLSNVMILVVCKIHKIQVNKKERKKERKKTVFVPFHMTGGYHCNITGISVDLPNCLKSRWMCSDSVMLSFYKIQSKQFWYDPRKTLQLDGCLP